MSHKMIERGFRAATSVAVAALLSLSCAPALATEDLPSGAPSGSQIPSSLTSTNETENLPTEELPSSAPSGSQVPSDSTSKNSAQDSEQLAPEDVDELGESPLASSRKAESNNSATHTATAGAENSDQALEAEAQPTPKVTYRVHVQTYGDQQEVSDGAVAGTSGESKRLEGAWMALSGAEGGIEYRTHVQREGWQGWVADGAMAGTEGRSLRLEGLEARLAGGSAGGGIEYRTHVQQDGWQDWSADGAMSGTEGRSLRLEAACVRLTGEAAELFDVWYRVHAQTYGWLGWASNGDPAGTEGLSRRLEAIEVRITAKGSGAPGSTEGAFIKNGSAGITMNTVPGDRSIVAFGGYNISQDAANRLYDAINGLRGRGYDVGFMMMDLGTSKGVAYNCDGVFYGASSIKAPYIVSVASKHPEVVSAYQHDITETLFYSWDFNYKQVYFAYGKDPMREMCQESGANPAIAESLPWANYSARDLALLWTRAYELYFQSPAVERIGVWCERPNVSTIHHTLGGQYRTRSKGGWIADGGVSTPSVNGGGPLWNVSDDGGIVYAANGPYVVAIMSSVPANHDMLDQLTSAIDGAHAEIQ